jgi:hypothetical protein
MLLLLLIIIAVIVIPAFSYVEYERWRHGAPMVKQPSDGLNHDPPKPPDTPKRLPNITDIGV